MGIKQSKEVKYHQDIKQLKAIDLHNMSTLFSLKSRANDGRAILEYLERDCKPSSDPVNPRTISTAAFLTWFACTRNTDLLQNIPKPNSQWTM